MFSQAVSAENTSVHAKWPSHAVKGFTSRTRPSLCPRGSYNQYPPMWEWSQGFHLQVPDPGGKAAGQLPGGVAHEVTWGPGSEGPCPEQHSAVATLKLLILLEPWHRVPCCPGPHKCYSWTHDTHLLPLPTPPPAPGLLSWRSHWGRGLGRGSQRHMHPEAPGVPGIASQEAKGALSGTSAPAPPRACRTSGPRGCESLEGMPTWLGGFIQPPQMRLNSPEA